VYVSEPCTKGRAHGEAGREKKSASSRTFALEYRRERESFYLFFSVFFFATGSGSGCQGEGGSRFEEEKVKDGWVREKKISVVALLGFPGGESTLTPACCA